jgi:MFS transporter, CP family, cyanate transporter
MQYRWIILGLALLLYSIFGLVMRSIAPLVTPIMNDLNLSYSQVGLILGSWQLAFILIAIFGGVLIDKWGIRKSLFLGTIFIALSEVLRYFANGFLAMFLCVALFGFGGPMISIGCPKAITQWFTEKDRAAAVGIYTTGPAIGGLIAYSTVNSLIMPLTGYSWRLTFLYLGLPAIVVALLWWFLAKDIQTASPTQSASIIKAFTNLIHLRNVQLVLVTGFLFFTIYHGFNNWLPKILETSGLSPETAGFMASIPLILNIPAVLIVPRLASPQLRGRILALISLVIALVLFTMTMASGVSLAVELVLWGLVSACGVPLLILTLMDIPEVGSRYIGSAGGLFYCIAEIGGFAGPSLFGAIKDNTGSFLGSTIFLGILSIAVCIMALSMKTQLPNDVKTTK